MPPSRAIVISVNGSPSPRVRRATPTCSSSSGRAAARSPEFSSAAARSASATSRSSSASGRFRQSSQRARHSSISTAPVNSLLQVGHSTQSFGWCAAALARQLTCARPPLLPARQQAHPARGEQRLLGVVFAVCELADPAHGPVGIAAAMRPRAPTSRRGTPAHGRGRPIRSPRGQQVCGKVNV